MKAIGLTFEGMEDISVREIFEIIGKKAKQDKRIVSFETKNNEDLCKLCYLGQSFIKILGVICEFDIEKYDEDTILSEIKRSNLGEWIKEGNSFAARVIVIDDMVIERTEAEALVGQGVIESLEFKPKVNLDDPDIQIVGLFYNHKFCLCIDFSGIDISKRDYRIFTHPSSLKAPLAYAMIKIGELKEGETILDPFCGSSTIAIETAHFLSKKSIHFFNKDKFAFVRFMDFDFDSEDANTKESIKSKIHSFDYQMRHIKASEKNAKISGIHNLINFSRTELDWLDTKFEKGSINKIITHPPQMSKLTSVKELEKLFTEFFYQADYVLAPKGKVVILSTEGRIDDMLKESASKKSFNLTSTTKIIHGQQTEHVLVFER